MSERNSYGFRHYEPEILIDGEWIPYPADEPVIFHAAHQAEANDILEYWRSGLGLVDEPDDWRCVRIGPCDHTDAEIEEMYDRREL